MNINVGAQPQKNYKKVFIIENYYIIETIKHLRQLLRK